MSLDALATPCLVADLDLVDANLALLASHFSGRHARLRPHFKSHKCVTLARRQLAAGSAVGITCAKLSEAEVLVAGGVRDVLIANQLCGEDKARRLADLNREATVRVAVDQLAQVTQLGRAAMAAGVTIGVLIEVDIGMDRCGVAPGDASVELARHVAGEGGLRFDGIQAYEGHLICLPDPAERREKTVAAMQLALATRWRLAEEGLPCAIFSGGGTGTYDITGDLEGIDEIQAGSYALMDAFYHRLRPEFACARTILATVISAGPRKAVVDVGLKGQGTEFGSPAIVGHPDATIRYVAEEHTVIDGISVEVGTRLHLIPSHGCTTNNLYRRMWIARQGEVVDCWPIEGSGCLE